ncbi:DUF1778 domain-containing protein [Candidatus Symbiopectobacterium sp. NZEC135]|uniref:type II toxin-antitoxin system TacA family antitoxin n=1 Tax=Candidatus Symbiopectobacterium sp. NZEC135 TaxID=2820471 RepID=UPI002226E534|nr:DUF1778 domain-containing protein [Candidatus Symbiopectobacterium sp. NZEC135]MCW2479975.1 DUF1778 domain-containing protein [Candidatus Symbiopectobacterium sp. NZEC135]
MRTEAKETPINIRAKASQRELIDVAAKLLSKSRTDFILEAACREAEEVLLDQRLFLVDEAQFDAFMTALEKPVATNERLHALLDRKSPWE